MIKKKIRYLLLGLVFSFVGACATSQLQHIPTGDPNESVKKLAADLAAAKANQVDVLAPGLFSNAQSAFKKAKQALDKGAKLISIREYVAEGSANLRKAEEIAQVSRTILGETNKAREKALKLGADRLGEPYLDVEKRYLILTKAIEDDNLSYAQKNAGRVQGAFRDLEIMAIKNNALGNVRNMMAEANKAKIKKIAPASYGAAELTLKEAETYIEQNPYAALTISQKTARAEFMARRMMTISESSKKFQEMTPEASALYTESLLARLGKTMNTGDLRDKSVEVQISTLTGAVETMERQNQSAIETMERQKQSAIETLILKNQSLEKDNQNYLDQIENLKQRLASLKGYSREQEEAKRKLAAEREFNERFNKVQRFFRSDEAEVYKQRGRLVIRLRGIQFSVGQATLTPENYTLLGKVQRAIQMFGQPNVIIEGHTDSTGSAQVNQELSQRRAEAVKTYLVANNTLPANHIQATGYGPNRPLAPDTTPEGRAINRRIDVLITPSKIP